MRLFLNLVTISYGRNESWGKSGIKTIWKRRLQGTELQQKEFIKVFLANLKTLEQPSTNIPNSSIWSIQMAILIHNIVDQIQITSKELEHKFAKGALPSVVVDAIDLKTIRACICLVQLYSTLRPSEIYQIVLSDLSEFCTQIVVSNKNKEETKKFPSSHNSSQVGDEQMKLLTEKINVGFYQKMRNLPAW